MGVAQISGEVQGEPRIKGARSLQEVEEERTGSRIPKVAGTVRSGNFFCNVV